MSRAARSVLVFGVYLLVVGANLLVAPNVMLGAFGMPPANEVWIRVAGVLVLCLAAYYVAAARGGWGGFLRLTVWVRGAVPLFFGGLVAAGLAPPALLIFGVVDFAAAIWTAVSLRADAAVASAA